MKSEKIKRYIGSGMSVREIAKKTGSSATYVRLVKNRVGVGAHSAKKAKSNGGLNVSERIRSIIRQEVMEIMSGI